METGRYIKKLRKSRGLSAEALAEKIYYTSKAISSWETGARFPSQSALFTLADFFDVSVHSLMLPKDNCSVDYIGYHPNIQNGDHTGGIWHESKDSEIAAFFLRKEYLAQKYLSGALGLATANELLTLEMLMNKGQYDLVDLEKYKDDNTVSEKAYTEFVLSNLDDIFKDSVVFWDDDYTTRIRRKTYCTFNSFSDIFYKLYFDEPMEQTLAAMNIIEKSILFTTAFYHSDTRNKSMTKILFDFGGRWINGILNNIPMEITDHLSKAKEIRDEDDFLIDDFNALYPYYVFIQFIAKSLSKMSYESFVQNVIEHADMSFEEYQLKIKDLEECHAQ